MARGEIEVRFSERRPCLVNGIKSLFHRFADNGQLRRVVAIVEYEDGTVHECYPYELRFLDSYGVFSEIAFPEEDDT